MNLDSRHIFFMIEKTLLQILNWQLLVFWVRQTYARIPTTAIKHIVKKLYGIENTILCSHILLVYEFSTQNNLLFEWLKPSYGMLFLIFISSSAFHLFFISLCLPVLVFCRIPQCWNFASFLSHNNLNSKHRSKEIFEFSKLQIHCMTWI